MELTRREFLKASGVGVGSILLLRALAPNVAASADIRRIPLITRRAEFHGLCPWVNEKAAI